MFVWNEINFFPLLCTYVVLHMYYSFSTYELCLIEVFIFICACLHICKIKWTDRTGKGSGGLATFLFQNFECCGLSSEIF